MQNYEFKQLESNLRYGQSTVPPVNLITLGQPWPVHLTTY